jgi:hypothetical protein
VCDDSYSPGVEVLIPEDLTLGGKLNPEYFMSYSECGADWKITKKELIKRNGKAFTRVRLKGGTACTIKIHERDFKKKRVFQLEIYDAC